MGSRLIAFFGFKFKMSTLAGDKVTHHAILHFQFFCETQKVLLLSKRSSFNSNEELHVLL